MPQLASTETSADIENQDEALEALTATQQELAATLAEIEAIVPPLWPLKDYVAVNPFLGLAERKFLDARTLLREVRDCELLPTADYFRAQLEAGRINRADIVSALEQCAREYPECYADLDVQWITAALETDAFGPSAAERRYFTISENVDRLQNTAWTSHIVNDITRHCAAHFDEGQAAWPNPWKELPLYKAWREAAVLSGRMDYLGIKGFRSLVRALPPKPAAAIATLLDQLGLSPIHWRNFLLSQIFSVAGWASFVKYRVREAATAGRRDEDLIGLLAVRLAYDVALARSEAAHGPVTLEQLAANTCPAEANENDVVLPPTETLTRYVLQAAAEVAYRRKLLGQLTLQRAGQRSQGRKSAQLIFCIDVRSEVMRRHLESLSETIETFGFAGFFGMSLEYVPLGESDGVAQCPVLLSPGFKVHETVHNAKHALRESAIIARRQQRSGRKVWKSFQTSAVSCFSFVESLGLLYLGKLLTDSLRVTRPVPSAHRDGLGQHRSATLGPDLHEHGAGCLSLAKKTDLAEGMLRNLGLTDGFARIVTICGHAADVVNNPYKAGLDCGACGGHSGEPNARVAAIILNERKVRVGLATRGIHIPDDTWFVPAVHNTTTDEIRLLDAEQRPETHAGELARLQEQLAEAGRKCRLERSRRMNGAAADDLLRRSRDWSEVRPEWGLAGNAAFIVAPRSRTAELNLGGRTFLHSYDQRKDPELKVLELIMTAPMIVTNWINLQYYASSVDNRAFGSGNKVIHNVVGQFGVLLGNGGDLMTGLPWQSVHDGVRFQHEPLRLLVVIEATREAVQSIIDKHALVRDLVSNGWLSLAVLEGETSYRRNSAGEWVLESFEQTPVESSSSADISLQGGS